MKICVKFATACLALAAIAAACTTVSSQPGRGGRVYLVGVAGAG